MALLALRLPVFTVGFVTRPAPLFARGCAAFAPGARRHATMCDAGAWPAERVRSQFVSYFEEKEHTMVASSPVVPYDDPTLLFANAGMNQFKPLFVGQAAPHAQQGRHDAQPNGHALP